MDDRIKQEWLAALRSGDYQQTGGFLHFQTSAGPKYCCLGVLTDLYLKENKQAHPYSKKRWEYEEETGCFEYNNVATCLVPDVIKWAGIESAVGEYKSALGCPSSLAEDNDTGKTFTEIADIIEAFF